MPLDSFEADDGSRSVAGSHPEQWFPHLCPGSHPETEAPVADGGSRSVAQFPPGGGESRQRRWFPLVAEVPVQGDGGSRPE